MEAIKTVIKNNNLSPSSGHSWHCTTVLKPLVSVKYLLIKKDFKNVESYSNNFLSFPLFFLFLKTYFSELKQGFCYLVAIAT